MAIKQLGIVLSRDQLQPEPGYECILGVRSQYIASSNVAVEADSVLTDTLNWVEVCGLYRAEGGERHLTIGVFSPTEQIDSVRQPFIHNNTRIAYYFIDDVAVTPVPAWAADPLQDTVVYQCAPGQPTMLRLRPGAQALPWNTGDTAVAITVNQPGWYYVENLVEDCAWVRDSLRVAGPQALTLDLGVDTLWLCPSELPYTFEPGVGGVGSFSWWAESGMATHEGANLLVSEPGRYTLRWLHPCQELLDSVVVALRNPPLPDLGPDTALCAANLTPWLLTAPPGYDAYVWQNGDTSRQQTVAGPGWYVLRASYVCGERADSVEVTLLDPPPLGLSGDTMLCAGSQLRLTAAAGYDAYRWDDGAVGPNRTIVQPGRYRLRASHLCGEAVAEVWVAAAAEIDLWLPPELRLPLGETITLNPLAAGVADSLSWRWQPPDGLSCTNCPTPQLLPRRDTRYQVWAQSPAGCRDSAWVQIRLDNRAAWYAPTAFSPNDDGVNDRLSLHLGPAVEQVLNWEVYNRWGGLVWRATGAIPAAPTVAGWDGQIKGEQASAGLYVWRATLLLVNGEHLETTGEALLVR